MKTFLYRSDGTGIDWAYPFSLENTGHKMTLHAGEQFFAAWAVDAFATPFVYGRLQNRKLTFAVHSQCANSGRQIHIELDSDLNIFSTTEGSDPMYSMVLLNTDRMKEPSIVDVFWRKSLFFWSEEDVREFKKRECDLRVYMNPSKRALAGVKRMQTSIFGFDEI